MAHRTAKAYRLRLVIGLPVMVLCFTLATGFLPIGMLRSTLKDISPSNELTGVFQNLQISVLLIALAATSLAAAIAYYIVRPIEHITEDILALAEQRSEGRVLFVEWGAPFIDVLGGDAVVIELEVSPRTARLSATGPRAGECLERLERLERPGF